MVLENICPPALLYLAFSIIQIIIDMYKGDTIQAFFKFIVMIIFTIVLNAICNSGMTIISWFIVFIPFILMTYITTILFFIFGVNPSKIQPSGKKCAETQYGCCPDGVTAKSDSFGRGCPRMRLADILKVPEPIPANSNDNRYLYPHDRSRYSYWIDGGGERYRDYSRDKRRSDWWRNKKINKWDSEYYNSKKYGKDKDEYKGTLKGIYYQKIIERILGKVYDKSCVDPKMIENLLEAIYDDSSIDPDIIEKLFDEVYGKSCINPKNMEKILEELLKELLKAPAAASSSSSASTAAAAGETSTSSTGTSSTGTSSTGTSSTGTSSTGTSSTGTSSTGTSSTGTSSTGTSSTGTSSTGTSSTGTSSTGTSSTGTSSTGTSSTGTSSTGTSSTGTRT
jgi:hypothetical protein